MKGRIAAGMLLLVATGCGGAREVEAKRAQLLAERRNLENTLDDLQARLLVNQARVRFWNEMRDRHESISAVACSSMEGHANDIARLLEGRTEKRYGLRRVAQRNPEPPRPPAATLGRGGP